MKINVAEYLDIPKHMAGGLVLKVTSPKGIRKFNEETQHYHYQLHTDTILVYDDREDNIYNPIELGEGLYWVVAICKTKDLGLHWNHFLFEVTESDTAELMGEYMNQMDSSWIPEALPMIKSYFKKKEQ